VLKKAGKLIGLSLKDTNEDYVVLVLDHAYFNLVAEQQLFFGICKVQTTIVDFYTKPKSALRWNLSDIIPAISITVENLLWQSRILFSHKSKTIAQDIERQIILFFKQISEKTPLEELVKKTEEMMSYVIAIGMLDSMLEEYVKTIIRPKYATNWEEIEQHYSDTYKKDDAYFQSFNQLSQIALGTKTLEQYLGEFGNRSFDDYELACPRFFEAPEKVQHIVNTYKDAPIKIDKRPLTVNITHLDKDLLDSSYAIKATRGRIRLQSLKLVTFLRKAIKVIAQKNNIPDDLIFFMKYEELTNPKESVEKAKGSKTTYHKSRTIQLPPLITKDNIDSLTVESTIGKHISCTAVSSGTITAKIHRVTTENSTPQANQYILVVPDASPRYSHLYPLAVGIIFEIGGTMSHGAIVAREYHKPAVSLGGKILEVKNDTVVELNGREGWIRLVE
jgi:phosphoenolpyruvate synthase/pyruvate phosphate dikinase